MATLSAEATRGKPSIGLARHRRARPAQFGDGRVRPMPARDRKASTINLAEDLSALSPERAKEFLVAALEPDTRSGVLRFSKVPSVIVRPEAIVNIQRQLEQTIGGSSKGILYLSGERSARDGVNPFESIVSTRAPLTLVHARRLMGAPAPLGWGPAGSSAAVTLARKGFSTLLVERGRSPGVKGMFGGRIYSWALQDLLPDWAKDCPVERYVVRENMVFLTEDASLGISFDSTKLGKGRAASFTAVRAKFDGWLAKKAQDAGATLVTGIRVDDLWKEDGHVRGVTVAPNDRVGADVVVIAEGATSILTRAAGLKADLEPREVSVGVKETIELPAETIQERFGLGEKEGAAFVFAGQSSLGLRGGGFLDTNQATNI